MKAGLSVTDAVIDVLSKAGYDNGTAPKVMIRSTDSAVLKEFKDKKNYELVYRVDETIRDAPDATIEDIKAFANSIVINKDSIYPQNNAYIVRATDIVSRLQSNGLPVYVELFDNEFVSQAWDFFSDATVEINSYVMGAGIDGVITSFPKTAASYKSKIPSFSLNLFPNYAKLFAMVFRLPGLILMRPTSSFYLILNYYIKILGECCKKYRCAICKTMLLQNANSNL